MPSPLPPTSAVPPLKSTQARAEAKAQLLLRLRARGIADLSLLRALEGAPHENFVGPAYLDLALRDVAVPLPCGQTMESPSALAHMLAALGKGTTAASSKSAAARAIRPWRSRCSAARW